MLYHFKMLEFEHSKVVFEFSTIIINYRNRRTFMYHDCQSPTLRKSPTATFLNTGTLPLYLQGYSKSNRNQDIWY